MRCLSIRQPWAWLIVHGWKPIENRTWSTSYRGPLLIHAGASVSIDSYAQAQRLTDRLGIDLPVLDAFERGGIVGQATLVDCLSSHTSPWFEGPVGWLFRDATPLPFRASKGQLGTVLVRGAPGSVLTRLLQPGRLAHWPQCYRRAPCHDTFPHHGDQFR